MYSKDGDDGLKDEVRDKERRSLFGGAELYENELYGSVRPPWMYSVFWTRATACPHLRQL